MSDPLYPVVIAAADLKLAAPREFDKLVEVLKGLENHLDTELRVAGANVIFTAQGKAQMVAQLRTKLENCLQLKNTYEQRK